MLTKEVGQMQKALKRQEEKEEKKLILEYLNLKPMIVFSCFFAFTYSDQYSNMSIKVYQAPSTFEDSQ